MVKYIKTVPIKAEQFDGSDDMINKYHVRCDTEYMLSDDPLEYQTALYQIETFEGWLNINAGDWIATGAKGEHWAIQDKVFNATYELVEEPAEIWKQVQSFEGYYEVSSLGRVRSIERIDSNGKVVPQRVLKGQTDKDGYLLVGLHKNGKRVTRRVHRLVASAFIPNKNGLPQINHIDKNKKNNCVGNLEWCDNKYNQYYDGTFRKANMATSTPVVALKDNEIVHMFKSTNEAGRYFGKKSGVLIQRCINHEKGYKTAYGYHWSRLPVADEIFKQTYQKLPVISASVAEFITWCKGQNTPLRNALYFESNGFMHSEQDEERIGGWIADHQDEFTRAWLDGYQIDNKS